MANIGWVLLVGCMAIPALIFLAWLVYRIFFVKVRCREALLKLSRTGKVLQIIEGPNQIFKLPFLHEIEIYDIPQRAVEWQAEQVTTSDGLAVKASIQVVYIFHPSKISKNKWNELYPVIQNYYDMVQDIAVHKLQELVKTFKMGDLISSQAKRDELNCQYKKKLVQAFESGLGQHVVDLKAQRIDIDPSPVILKAQIDATARVQALTSFTAAFEANQVFQQTVRAELMEQLLSGDADVSLMGNMPLYESTAQAPQPIPVVNYMVGTRVK